MDEERVANYTNFFVSVYTIVLVFTEFYTGKSGFSDVEYFLSRQYSTLKPGSDNLRTKLTNLRTWYPQTH